MKRRRAVDQVCRALKVSERRACRALRQPRSSQRYTPRVADDEQRLVSRIVELATQYGRYGYRKITDLLRREGWRVNHKRVARLWRREGLKVPQKQPKRKRLWLGDGSCIRRRPEHRNHVWSYDFLHDRTHNGLPFRVLTIMDEYTRECLSMDVARGLNSGHVLERLGELFVNRGVPSYIRSDNGPEFTAQAVRRWLSRMGVTTLFIEPGSPWENGYVESLHSILRNELIDREIFTSLREAQVLIERWRVEYNTFRPHGSLGGQPPAPETMETPLLETPILDAALHG